MTDIAEKVEALNYRLVEVDSLIPYALNARTHSDEQVRMIASSIKEFGWTNPMLVDGENGIIAGHGRLAAARMLGLKRVPVIELSGLSDVQRRAYILADNRLAEHAGWDDGALRIELEFLRDSEFDLELTGFDDKYLDDLIGEGGEAGDGPGTSLADKFMIPPFSVLNAREGWWQERKRNWIDLGIKSEVGREDSLTWRKGDDYAGKVMADMGTTSVFDPVLCELAYRWFSPVGGNVLDPFAGGSVRGIVAAKLGRNYFGNDLRSEQVEANRAQWDAVVDKSMTYGAAPAGSPVWNAGDSRDIVKHAKGYAADMIFSCPPYADLEVYSDDPDDLSTLGYDEFREAYREIIAESCKLLRDNRFACFVVGEVRDKKGFYYNFVGDTIQAFIDAGLKFYNEAILVTAVGSLPIRAGKQFTATRKMGKTHQNVLVFVKGDPKKAAADCGDPMVPEMVFPPEPEGEDMLTCPKCGHGWIRGFEG